MTSRRPGRTALLVLATAFLAALVLPLTARPASACIVSYDYRPNIKIDLSKPGRPSESRAATAPPTPAWSSSSPWPSPPSASPGCAPSGAARRSPPRPPRTRPVPGARSSPATSEPLPSGRPRRTPPPRRTRPRRPQPSRSVPRPWRPSPIRAATPYQVLRRTWIPPCRIPAPTCRTQALARHPQARPGGPHRPRPATSLLRAHRTVPDPATPTRRLPPPSVRPAAFRARQEIDQ